MKKVIFIMLVVSLLFACTKYEEDIKIPVQDYKTLSPDNINTTLKIANLIVDQAEFNEMYSNFGIDIEIDAVLSVYKNGEILLENEVVEIEIKGSSSAKYSLKSLGVKFDNTYNNEDRKLIDPEILPFHSLDKIKAFRFRNSGIDFRSTMLKDMSLTKLAIDAGLNIDLTYAEQVVVFVNDAFYGVMNLRTEANTNGMSRLYDVSKSEITLAKINGDGGLEMKDGDFDKIANFIDAIENGDFTYLSNEIDVDNFIDYMIFESYIGNLDWPRNNVRFFAINDGPFRFIMFDLDAAVNRGIDNPPLSFINNSGTANVITDLFNVMYADETFKNIYDARFNDLNNSGLLSSERLDNIITDYKSNIEHIMPVQIDKYNYPETYTNWYINLEQLKHNYKNREDYLK